MAWKAGAGHIGGSLSEVEILAVPYFHVIQVDPKNPTWNERDCLILSKGHGVLGLCATLYEREVLINANIYAQESN